MIRHFTSHLDEILEHHEGYRGQRLVTFLAGAEGYAHGIRLVLPPATKILSHWHDDREAIFYCTGGQGWYLLEDQAREVGVGDAMFVPLMAMHGFAAGDSHFEILDFALFSTIRSEAEVDDCFIHLDNCAIEPTRFGSRQTFFPSSIYGNQAIKWVGRYELDTGEAFATPDVPTGTEQIVMVERGEGELRYLDRTVPLRAGSIAYLIADVGFELAPTNGARLALLATSSLPGRYPGPPLFTALRRTYGWGGAESGE